LGRVWAVPGLCELHLSICLIIEGKARKNLSQGSKTSVRVEKLQSRKTSVRKENLSQGRKNFSQSRKTSVRVEKPQSG